MKRYRVHPSVCPSVCHSMDLQQQTRCCGPGRQEILIDCCSSGMRWVNALLTAYVGSWTQACFAHINSTIALTWIIMFTNTPSVAYVKLKYFAFLWSPLLKMHTSTLLKCFCYILDRTIAVIVVATYESIVLWQLDVVVDNFGRSMLWSRLWEVCCLYSYVQKECEDFHLIWGIIFLLEMWLVPYHCVQCIGR